jgi:alkanesulfonate monooxygenase SsuD/methylene tetrahydromethanopterin reductase-like flavin-dependent oxidoreductase (luciferase family)
VLGELAKANGDVLGDDDHVLAGSPQQIADELRPLLAVGFSHVIADLMRPYDAETIDRLPELREALAG